MKKLYLTSFTFTTGTEEVHTQFRLVVVTKKEIMDYRLKSEINYPYDHGLYTAQEKAEKWFKKTFPNSAMISIVSHEAIEQMDDEPVTLNRSEFDLKVLNGYLAFGLDEFPPREEKNPDKSIDVLIDLDGYRKEFRVGYYSFPYDGIGGEWLIYDGDSEITEHMKWMDILPLASKDGK